MGRIFTGLIAMFLLLAIIKNVGFTPFQNFFGIIPGANNRVGNNSNRQSTDNPPSTNSPYYTQQARPPYSTNPPYSQQPPPPDSGDGAVPAYW